ncbi:CRISPR-associated protein Cas5 [Desulfobacterales bacterium HSG2]|nr:CRISPR-associated protein Cas5 [Desulfobacterales bacterium HSG2]
MEVLAFDVCGKFAHFRKFYSNSSALTHFIPPRTTIIGIIAGMLGIERDTYYEDFSLENCDIGIRVLSRVRKSVQKLKYLKVEHLNDLNGSYFQATKNMYISNTMVPFEFLSPLKIRETGSFVSYRFYYRSKTDKNRPHFEKLGEQLKKGKETCYPVSFGTANFTAFTDNFVLYGDAETVNSDESILIDSAIPLNCLEEFPGPGNAGCHLVQETLPMDFDKDRYLKTHSQVLFDLNGNSLDVKLNSDYFLLSRDDRKERILFLR